VANVGRGWRFGSLLAAGRIFDRRTHRGAGDPGGSRGGMGAGRVSASSATSSRPQKVAGAVGALASLTAVGAGLGIVLAGPIVDVVGLSLVVLAAADPDLGSRRCPRCCSFRKSPVRTPGRIGWMPALLLSAWLVALLVALSEAPAWGLGLGPGDWPVGRGGGGDRGGLGGCRVARHDTTDRYADDGGRRPSGQTIWWPC